MKLARELARASMTEKERAEEEREMKEQEEAIRAEKEEEQRLLQESRDRAARRKKKKADHVAWLQRRRVSAQSLHLYVRLLFFIHLA